MEIRLLGLVELRLHGDHVALGAAKPRAVLAMLALHANERVSADRLAEGLWGEQPPPSAAKMVQIYVSRVRKLLDGGAAEIVTRGRGYELRIPPDCVDALRFERLVEAASRNRGHTNGALWEALSLWRGPPLDDLADEPFAVAEIHRLEELWLRAREFAIDEALAAGEHDRVIGELDELVAQHPLRERLRAQRMLALYGCGRQAEALEAYRQARELLVGEIGVEPGPELRRVHEAILHQDPSLAPTAEARVAAAPSAVPETDAAPRHERRTRALVAAAAVVAVAGVAVIVGRLASSDGLAQIDANAVGLIEPADGRITAQYAVGRDPGPLAAGDGSVWVASAAAGTVSRIDRSAEQITTIDVAGEPTALAFAAGSLWVADGEHRSLTQIDSRTNRVVDRVPVGNSPRGVAATRDAVWVASAVDGRIDRIDLNRGGRRRQVEVQGGPTAIAAGAGAVWVASEDAGIVTRLEPRTGAALEVVGVGNAPTALAVGYGAVWVANRADGTVSRIDRRTNAVTDTIAVGGSPVAIAAAADAVWVADPPRGVVRIDPGGRRVDSRVDVGSSPAGLVFASGSLWTSALAPPTSHRGGTLRLKTGAFDTVDPTRYDGRNWMLLSPAYDGLLAYRRVAGTAGTVLAGNLATGVPQPVDGGRTYVFQLRRDVRFADGSEVRPEDFRASLERLLRLGGPSVRPLFAGIVGAANCNRRACDLREGIETDSSARTITIHLRTPEPDFPHKLTIPLAYVVPAESPVRLMRTRALPGTGPYRIAAFDPARGGRLTRNPHFRSSSLRPDGFPDEIAFSFTRRTRAGVSAVRHGDADVVQVGGGAGDELSLKDLRALAVADPSHLHSAARPHTEFLFLNVREPPFDDVRVRRALNYAVDRRHVARLIGTRAADVTCQLLPSGLPGHEPVCPYTGGLAESGGWTAPDLSRARQLVQETGVTGARVEVWGARGWSEDVVRYAARLLRRLGYRARARFKPDIGQYFAYLAAPRHPPQAGYSGWIADVFTPSNFIVPTMSCAADRTSNPSRFCDPQLESLIDRGTAAEGSEANELWAQADRRVVRAAPIVPLVNRRSVLLVSDRVGNVEQHLQLGPLLDQMWVR